MLLAHEPDDRTTQPNNRYPQRPVTCPKTRRQIAESDDEVQHRNSADEAAPSTGSWPGHGSHGRSLACGDRRQPQDVRI